MNNTNTHAISLPTINGLQPHLTIRHEYAHTLHTDVLHFQYHKTIFSLIIKNDSGTIIQRSHTHDPSTILEHIAALTQNALRATHQSEHNIVHYLRIILQTLSDHPKLFPSPPGSPT